MAGGDKGEGGIDNHMKIYLISHPHPNPPPSRGRELLDIFGWALAIHARSNPEDSQKKVTQSSFLGGFSLSLRIKISPIAISAISPALLSSSGLA